MTLKSKMLALSTVAVLTISFTGHSFASSNPFTDLTQVTPKEIILEMQEKGYVKGVGDDLFAPNESITTVQGVQLIVNALELNLDLVRFIKEPKATDYFINANNDAWYADALIVAAVNGIELPRDLDPSQEWTRETFAYYLVRAIEAHGNLPMINLVPTEIADEDQITIDYSGAIQRALLYGIVKLDAEGNLNPKGELIRAEAVEQTYNALKYLEAHPTPDLEPEETIIK